MSTMRNSVMLVGRPDSEPEMETLSNNQKVARFRIGVNEPYINANNERVDNTYWFNVVALNSFADKVMEVVSPQNEAKERHRHKNVFRNHNMSRVSGNSIH